MQKNPHFIYHLQHIENAFETQLASLVTLQLKRRHFQVNAVYPKLISIPWVELKANRIWGQLKESLRDFPNSGQIRENFFHIVSYFLGFFCMAGFSFSTSRVVVEEQQQQPLCWGPLQPHGLSQTLLAFPPRFQRSSKTITMKASPTWLQKEFSTHF